MITRQSGNFIINGALYTLAAGQEVSYPDAASVQEFDTPELAQAAHQEQYPDQYIDEDAVPLDSDGVPIREVVDDD